MLTPGNAGKPVTIYNVASIVGTAYPKAFFPSNIISGFRVSGFVLLNENIFTEDEFASSKVTDRPLDLPSANLVDRIHKIG